jgi:hypothetical protein
MDGFATLNQPIISVGSKRGKVATHVNMMIIVKRMDISSALSVLLNSIRANADKKCVIVQEMILITFATKSTAKSL